MSVGFVYVIRHARAGDRARWTEPDILRPLTARGRLQAERLVTMFADVAFAKLVSSPFVRCVQTLEPLARARGLAIDETFDLAEGRGFELLEKIVLDLGHSGPAAVCVHGEVQQQLIEDLLDRGVRLRGRGPVEFKKGSTWILEVQDGLVTAARCLPPPREPRGSHY